MWPLQRAHASHRSRLSHAKRGFLRRAAVYGKSRSAIGRGARGRRARLVNRPRAIWVIVLASTSAMLLFVAPPEPETIKWVIAARFPTVSWVDADTLARWMDDDADKTLVLLDARTEEEYAVSHLRHAIWAGPDGTGLSELSLPDDAVVVVYCSVGYRSAAVAGKLRDRNVHQVYNLTGGIFGWANAGRPLFRDEKRVDEVHPYSETWRWLVREDLRAR